jgi:hypothetical protein
MWSISSNLPKRDKLPETSTGAGQGLMFQYPEKFSKVLQTFLTTKNSG